MIEGKEYLRAHPPENSDNALRDTYYWYYATQVMFNLGGPEWVQWNRDIAARLIETQCQDGCAMGSWDPERADPGRVGHERGAAGDHHGLSTLTLEVYYRYLPLYQMGGGEGHPAAPPAVPPAVRRRRSCRIRARGRLRRGCHPAAAKRHGIGDVKDEGIRDWDLACWRLSHAGSDMENLPSLHRGHAFRRRPAAQRHRRCRAGRSPRTRPLRRTKRTARSLGAVEFDKESEFPTSASASRGACRRWSSSAMAAKKSCSRWSTAKSPTTCSAAYCRTLFASYLLQPRQQRVLIVGLGGGAMVHFLKHYDPEVKVDALEIDPVVVEVADRYFDVRSEGNVNIITTDGVKYLEQTRRSATT